MHRSIPLRASLAAVVGMLCGMLVLAPAFAGGVSNQEKTVQQVVAEIDLMHQKVDQYNEDIVVALDQKTQLDAQIVVSQAKIAEQQTQLAQLEVQLGNVAVSKVMGGGSGALGPLFSDPVALDETLQRDHLAMVAVDAGAATSDDYETLLSQMQDEEASLKKNQEQAVVLAQQAEVSRTKAEQALKDLEARETQERSKLGSLIDQEEQRQSDKAAAEYAAQVKAAQTKAAAQAAAAQSSNNSSSNNSGSNNAGSNNAGSNNNSVSSTSSGSTSTSGSGSSNAGSSGSSGDGGSANVPVSSRASVAVNAAAGQQGVPYRFATSNPGVSFDCSGLTAYAWETAGVNLPHQSGQQYASTPHVPKESAQPGDLIFYYSPISHVGIYIGGGQLIHAPATGKFVSVATVRWDKVVGVSRPG
ncbi:MAG: NlpC/P60 family protein [Ilumatobacteraceae bacterium]